MVAQLTAVDDMEDLQWFDTSLGMNKVMRTYNGGMHLIHFLVGGRGGHHQLCLPHGLQCGTAFVSLWWLQQCH